MTWILRGTPPDLALLGEADYLGALGVLPVLALWMVTFGLGEEVGWRGFALPRLQSSHSAFRASLVLGLFWAVWHVPAIFYRDTYMAMGWMVVPMLLTVAAVGSVVYTWLFNGTRGSLLLVILFHGLFDFFSVWPAGRGRPRHGHDHPHGLLGRARLQALRRTKPISAREGHPLIRRAAEEDHRRGLPRGVIVPLPRGITSPQSPHSRSRRPFNPRARRPRPFPPSAPPAAGG